MTHDLIKALQNAFEASKRKDVAIQQQAYMRNFFPFLGLKSPIRKKIQKPIFKHFSHIDAQHLAVISKTLWAMDSREYQYAAMEWAAKYKKKWRREDIRLLEYLITHKSWWDSVDFIASHLVGSYFQKYPEQISLYTQKWIHSDNIWLQRSAILFPLKYKHEVNTKLLEELITIRIHDKEFFIRKAIGWMLREYSKTNAKWVIAFVENYPDLSPLSKKEA